MIVLNVTDIYSHKLIFFSSLTFLSGKEKAKWGLDILYTKEMNSFVRPLLEQSNQRIQVVKLHLEVPVIIINVYLPSSSLPQQEYDDSLNFRAATLSNHEAEAAIFVIGEFYRSFFRNNPGDRKFQNFCQTVGLLPAPGTNQNASYHGYNGSSNKIDYVMMHRASCLSFGIKEDNLFLITQLFTEEDPSIISTHDAIVFELKIPINQAAQHEEPAVKSVPVVNKKILWENADIDSYQRNLEMILEENFQFGTHLNVPQF